MAVGFDETHRNKIGNQLALRVAEALTNHELTLKDLPEIADYILLQLKQIQSHQELTLFLKNLSSKWPVFKNISDIEKGEEVMDKEKKQIDQVEKFMQEKKVDQALNTANNLIKQSNSQLGG